MSLSLFRILTFAFLFLSGIRYAQANDYVDYDDLDDEELYIGQPIKGNANIKDPFEKFNRKMYAFNKGVDKVLLLPLAKTYRATTPSWGRQRVKDFLHNLREPLNFINYVAQAEGCKARKSLSRFLVNSTLGVGGLVDIASTQNELRIEDTGFTETLAKYGGKDGAFLILPILGPSTVRDFTGTLVDAAIDPVNHVKLSSVAHPDNVLVPAKVISTRETLIEAIDHIEATALDEYTALRSMYLQRKR
jgi:phospholipid-binding lipoprotein MlaA